jgi:hypothetical protein
MKSVEQNRKWLAWFLDLAQQPESDREASIAEMGLRQFAHSLKPQLQVDWDAEPFGAPPTKPLRMMKRREAAPLVTDELCNQCGRPVIYHTQPNRWDPTGSWYCEHHEAAARGREAEDSESDSLMPGLQAANTPQASERPTVRPRGTDLGALLHEVLAGLNSFLANSEWTFPPLSLTPTVSLGSSKQAKPERHIMGSLRDVVLAGISDLLMVHGHKIRRCKARKCARAFLSVRRQTFCSNRCASNTRSDRFQRKLGEKGFRERRRRYYVRAQRLVTGNPNLRVGRRRKRRG